MTVDLIEAFGLGPHELVAFIGGGGKTTLLFGLSAQLAANGHRVIVTTTTKLGLDQTSGRRLCWSDDPAQINEALGEEGSLLVVSEADHHKVLGYAPDVVAGWFSSTRATYILVEADGARRRPLKAPAGHEPVVPSSASVVVIVMGIDAIGQTFAAAAHRPEQASKLTGLSESDLITPQSAASILAHPDGGLRGIPDTSRVVVALTKVAPSHRPQAALMRDLLLSSDRIEAVVTVPFSPTAISGRAAKDLGRTVRNQPEDRRDGYV